MTDNITPPVLPSVATEEDQGLWSHDLFGDDPSQFAFSGSDDYSLQLPFDGYQLPTEEYAGDDGTSVEDPHQFSSNDPDGLASYAPFDDFGPPPEGYAEHLDFIGEEELAQLMSSGQWMLVPYIPSEDDWFSAEEYPVDPYTSVEDVPSHFSTGGQDALAPPYVAAGDDGWGYSEGNEGYAQPEDGILSPLELASGTHLLNPGELDAGSFADNLSDHASLNSLHEENFSDFGSATYDYDYYLPQHQAQDPEAGSSNSLDPWAVANEPTDGASISSSGPWFAVDNDEQESVSSLDEAATPQDLHDWPAHPGSFKDVGSTSKAEDDHESEDPHRQGESDHLQFPLSILALERASTLSDGSDYRRALAAAIDGFRAKATKSDYDEGEKSKRKNEETGEPSRKKKQHLRLISRNGKARKESLYSIETSNDWEFQCPLPSKSGERACCGVWTNAKDAQSHLEQFHHGFPERDSDGAGYHCPVSKGLGKVCGKRLKIASHSGGRPAIYSLKKHLLSSRYHPGLSGRRKGSTKVGSYPTYVCRYPGCGYESMTYVGGELSRMREHWALAHNQPGGSRACGEEDDEDNEEDKGEEATEGEEDEEDEALEDREGSEHYADGLTT